MSESMNQSNLYPFSMIDSNSLGKIQSEGVILKLVKLNYFVRIGLSTLLIFNTSNFPVK